MNNAVLKNCPMIDSWIEEEQDNLFIPIKGGILIPSISNILGIEQDLFLNRFNTSMKKAYVKIGENKPLNHFAHYLNYFEKFYDTDHELLMIYTKLKLLIDTVHDYPIDKFENDVRRYLIFNRNFDLLISELVSRNTIIKMSSYHNSNRALAFTDKHMALLMKASIHIITIIPIILHYAYIHQNLYQNINSYIIHFYKIVLKELITETDLISKITETVTETYNKSSKRDNILWNKQDIMGENLESRILTCIETIVHSVIPKYVFTSNCVTLNQVVIKSSLKNSVLDIKYDFELNKLDTSNYDEDNNTEFDKFEAMLLKTDESLYLQHRVNYENTIARLMAAYGPFDQDEIDYYKNELRRNGDNPVNTLQRSLIFYLFYKYFGDTVPLMLIDLEEYIKLMIIAKRILNNRGLSLMASIVSAKVIKVINRVTMNKRELERIKASKFYTYLVYKYKNEKVVYVCLAVLTKILSSKFNIISYEHQDLTGTPLPIKSDILNQEFMEYISLC